MYCQQKVTMSVCVFQEKIQKARKVEKDVYSQAMVEMRNIIQEEVKEMRRLSGLTSDEDVYSDASRSPDKDNQSESGVCSASQSLLSPSSASQSEIREEEEEEDAATAAKIEVSFDHSESTEDFELQIRELRLELDQSDTSREEVNMSQSESSEVSSSMNQSDYRGESRLSQSVHSDVSEGREVFRLDESKRSRSQELSILDHSDGAIERLVNFLMEEQALAMSTEDVTVATRGASVSGISDHSGGGPEVSDLCRQGHH